MISLKKKTHVSTCFPQFPGKPPAETTLHRAQRRYFRPGGGRGDAHVAGAAAVAHRHHRLE